MRKYGTYQVNPKSDPANNEDQLWILDLLWIQESLDRLDKDGEAESDQENRIDKSSHNLLMFKGRLLIGVLCIYGLDRG